MEWSMTSVWRKHCTFMVAFFLTAWCGLEQDHFPRRDTVYHQSSFSFTRVNVAFPGQLMAKRGTEIQSFIRQTSFHFQNYPLLEGCLVPVVLRKSLGLQLEAISCVLLRQISHNPRVGWHTLEAGRV